MQTELLVNKYLPILQPKIVVYEVNPDIFSTDGIESTLNLMANDNLDWSFLKLAITQKHIKVINSFIYGFYNTLLNRNEAFNEPLFTAEDSYVSGGYVERKMQFFKIDTAIVTPNSLEIKAHQRDAYSTILKTINQSNAKLILVQAPITKSKYASYKNMNAFDRWMGLWAPYYNFNNLVNLNDSLHFYDSHHLNQNGVLLFNQKVLEFIPFEKLIKND